MTRASPLKRPSGASWMPLQAATQSRCSEFTTGSLWCYCSLNNALFNAWRFYFLILKLLAHKKIVTTVREWKSVYCFDMFDSQCQMLTLHMIPYFHPLILAYKKLWALWGNKIYTLFWYVWQPVPNAYLFTFWTLSMFQVQAVFVGHNHGLDWCCPDHNLYLCFARHTGYGGYGKWKRGARFVEILQAPEFQIRTLVTLEDGSVVSDMLLNWSSTSMSSLREACNCPFLK